jgi:hypothetical protein
MKMDPNAPINPYKHLNCNGQIDNQYKGLTKREYFATMAMQGLLAKYNLKTPEDQEIIAKISIQLADTFISELNK